MDNKSKLFFRFTFKLVGLVFIYLILVGLLIPLASGVCDTNNTLCDNVSTDYILWTWDIPVNNTVNITIDNTLIESDSLRESYFYSGLYPGSMHYIELDFNASNDTSLYSTTTDQIFIYLSDYLAFVVIGFCLMILGIKAKILFLPAWICLLYGGINAVSNTHNSSVVIAVFVLSMIALFIFFIGVRE